MKEQVYHYATSCIGTLAWHLADPPPRASRYHGACLGGLGRVPHMTKAQLHFWVLIKFFGVTITILEVPYHQLHDGNGALIA